VPCRRGQNAAGGSAQCLGRTHAAENAVVVLESVRRAGGVPFKPPSVIPQEPLTDSFALHDGPFFDMTSVELGV